MSGEQGVSGTEDIKRQVGTVAEVGPDHHVRRPFRWRHGAQDLGGWDSEPGDPQHGELRDAVEVGEDLGSGQRPEAIPGPPALPARRSRAVDPQIPGLLIARRNRPVMQHRHPRLNILARRKPRVIAVAARRPVTAGYERLIARLAGHLMD